MWAVKEQWKMQLEKNQSAVAARYAVRLVGACCDQGAEGRESLTRRIVDGRQIPRPDRDGEDAVTRITVPTPWGQPNHCAFGARGGIWARAFGLTV